MQQINENLVVLDPNDQMDDSLAASYLKIFLGGSVDLGDNFNWHAKFIQGMNKLTNPAGGDPRFNTRKYMLLCPRMPISNPAADLGNPEFTTKITWELGMMKAADAIFCNFLKKAQSQSGMYEFMLSAYSGKTVCRCPIEYPGYAWIRLISQDTGISLLQDRATVLDVMLELYSKIPVFQEAWKYGLQ